MATPGNGFKYRTYSEVATQQIGLTQDDGGCGASGQTLPADTWVTVFTINVSNNSGCTAFQIVNDAFTALPTENRNFFVSLGGSPRTGTIEPTGVNIGACTADCLGVIGGTALPGTACNDNNACTTNDTWNASCQCVGTAISGPTLTSVSNNGPICAGQNLQLSASATGSGTINYSWTGPGFTSGLQNPTITGAATAASGLYTVTASNGCGTDATGNTTATVTAAPSATINYAGTPYCSNGGTATVTRTGTAGGSYNATPAGLSINAGSGAVDLGASTAGTYTVTYTVATAGGCAQFQTTASITVTAAPSATINYGGSPYCSNGGTATVTRTGTAGGSYSASPAGLSINAGSGTVDLGASTAGTYTVTYTVAAAGGCAQFQTTASITVTAATTWYADADGDGAGDPNDQQIACAQPNGYVANNGDLCPADGNKTAPGACGCGVADTDSDNDGIADCNDSCPTVAGQIGSPCNDGNPNTSGDVLNASCQCVGSAIPCPDDGDPCTSEVVIDGVCTHQPLPDSDNDGTCDLIDGCPNDPNKIAAGACGCGVADTDSDNDGTPNCNDGCPNDPNKIAAGACGCGVPDTDSDNDGVADCNDSCPNLAGQIGSPCDDGNPNTNGDVITSGCVCEGSTVPCPDDGNPCTAEVVVNGVCTHQPLPDTDNDGTCDLIDGCPNDPNKIAAGVCGCGVADTDSDNDGTPNCNDGCPNDPNKIAAGVCGCGVADTDSDNDGTPNCNDGCPNDPNKIAAGACGCGVADTDTDNDGIADCNDSCPNVPGQVGSSCNDGNPNTTGDVINAACVCAGTPVTGCDNQLNLVVETDANGGQTTWEIIPQGGGAPVCSGGPFTGMDQSFISQTCCLANGCYVLRVFDSAGDGISTGGYVLSTQNGRRIIDNRDNGAGFTSTSQIANGEGFCLPLGTDRLITTSCDKEWWVANDYIVANDNPLVAAQWQVGDQTDDGYEMWFFNPNGGYSFRRFHSHAVSDGFANVGASRACHIKINNWSAVNHIPQGVLLNVRVRGRVNGGNLEWGPACRFRLDPALALCPPTQLVNQNGIPEFSCGVTRQFPSTQRLWAWSRRGANRYQFEFSLPAENFLLVRTATTSNVQLNWTGTPLLNGRTYNVRVRVSLNGGATWCAWGETCLVTISNPGGTGGQQNMAATSDERVFGLYPNPNNGEQVMLTLGGLDTRTETVSVEMYDLFGAQVMSRTIATQEGGLNTMMELPGTLATGVYVVRVMAEGKTWTERMAVQR